MNLDKLKYFVDLVDTGSFTKTGLKNHIAQTSISQQIHSLESYFNVKLVDRNVNPVQPTTAGKILYKEALKTLYQYQLLEQELDDFKSKQAHLRIEYTSVLELDFLIKFVNILKKETTLLINLEKVQLKNISENLKNGKYDLAISFESEFQNESLISTLPLYEGQYAVLVGKGHPFYSKKSITVTELYTEPMVMLSPDTIGKSYQLMLENSKKDGFEPTVSTTVVDIETELFLVQTQKLFGLLPNNYPLPQQNKELRLIPIQKTNHQFKIVFAYRKDLDFFKLKQIINAIQSLDYSKNL